MECVPHILWYLIWSLRAATSVVLWVDNHIDSEYFFVPEEDDFLTEGDTINGAQLTWPLFVVARSRGKAVARCGIPKLFHNSLIGVMGKKVSKITHTEMNIQAKQ